MIEPAVINAVKVVTAVGRVFGDDDHPPSETPLQRTNTALYGPGGPPAAPPPAPAPPADQAGGLNDGASNAGDQYNRNVDGAALTDDKLATLLKQIFESNQQARDKVNAILADIQAKSKQIAPEMGDPASVMAFQKYMDQKFGEIQKLLSDSQVDAKTQAAIMDALGQEYRTNGPKPGEGEDKGSAGGSEGGSGGDGSGGGGGGDAAPPADAGAGVGAPPADAGADPLTDPLAGMGPMGMGGMGGMDPMSSLAGLGSALPGMLGGLGAGGGSPLDSLGGALGGLGSALPGLASQFSDKNGQDPASTDDKFTDTKGDGKADNPEDSFKDDEGKSDDPPADKDQEDAKTPADPNTVQPVANTPAEAAPAAAPAVDGHTVSLPDGTSVNAPDDQRKNAMEAVVNGKSVSDAYGGQIPPAGSPVMNPVDRNSLRPGDYAQYEAKPQVMYMGNGKIWLDGQLKPVSALPSSSDFLGWTGPPAAGGGAQAAVPAPAPGTPASASVTTAPPTGNPTA
ncbi:DUF4226 domain-containing protein [Mycolicibacterium neoaurum]|uniref:DUF4226 domain-containing protein n=1 Tax=Mycolicibacterium neoaurum TaxID=1795 RepID=UPI001F4D1AF9|nr:DUF4226 domain-containing protein [Mycolicibacterium neoaurum]